MVLDMITPQESNKKLFRRRHFSRMSWVSNIQTVPGISEILLLSPC